MNQNILAGFIRHENQYGNWWYEDDICKKDGCNILINSCDNNYNAGTGGTAPKRILYCRDDYLAACKDRAEKRNPRTNAISKIAYKIAGGATTFYKKSRDERLLIRKEATKGYLLNERPADEVIEYLNKLPERQPARKRANLEPLDKLPPEGWVYIIAASRHASIMKIGSTFEHGVRDRLSEAKRWALAGSAVLLHKEWFSRCKQAESLVHKRLDYYRIVSPDAGDELFRTSFEHALANVMIIKNEVENDRKEQAMG